MTWVFVTFHASARLHVYQVLDLPMRAYLLLSFLCACSPSVHPFFLAPVLWGIDNQWYPLGTANF